VDHRFRRADRVRLHREYDRVYQKGRRAAGRFILLYAVTNELDRTRLGITAGRRVGGAVRRNRLKRWVRETFRLHRAEFPPGCDVVVQVRPASSTATHAALAADIRAVAERLTHKGP
jgi:ribonuclease P protein component